LLALGALVFAAYYERAYARLALGFEGDVAALRSFRWERPVLRGPTGDGNAADEIYAALSDWQPLGNSLRNSLSQHVFLGQRADAAPVAELQARRPQLQRLRASVQQRWSHTELTPELGANLHVPNYAHVSEAALLLLIEAQSAPAEMCLQEAFDVIRIGQDLIPAAPLEAASVASHIDALAAPVIARCARATNIVSLLRAIRELHVLAAYAPPIGTSIELEELVAASDLRRRAALANKRSPWQVLSTLIARPELLSALRSYENPARFRTITPDRYPDAMDDWKREQAYRTRTGSSNGARRSDDVLARLQDDMRGQAIVRMLCIGLNTIGHRAYHGVLPNQPIALHDKTLVDPFRGQPFHYRFSANPEELILWSVGEDFHDDNGSEEWSDAAPRDVVLHFALGREATTN
jgi:hypothetical protein